MKLNRNTVLIFVLSLALPATSLSARPTQRVTKPVDNDCRVRLTGHLHPGVETAADEGALDSSEVLPALTLTLRPTAEQEAELQKLLSQQQDPASPNYHQWLTPEQYAERFGVSSADVDKISSWLEQQNLHVTSVARAHNSITFTGTAGDVSKAFRTELRHYRSGTTTHFANAEEPSIPVAFDTVIGSIRGLNNYRMKPHARLHKLSVEPNYTSSGGNHYISPADVQLVYGMKALHAAGYNGTGQTIVIAGQTQIDLSDIQQFRSRYNLPAGDPSVVLVPGTQDPGIVKDDLAEAHLDIEWASAAAPNAKIQYVYATDVMEAVQYAIDKNLGPVISVSYGLCEPQTPLSDAMTMQSWARQANAQGITWVNASGDSGGADCVSSTSTRNAGLSVDIPAGIPEVTGVGGTSFNEGTGSYWNATNDAYSGSVLSWIPEVTWNDSAPGDPAAGGGGASTYFSKPSWQTGAGVPSDGARDVPDISLNSSAEHDGYLVFTSGKTSVYGGTSAATPVFAGILTLLNQYLVATGAQSIPGLGNINPRLYALAQTNPSAFHDVVSGDNIVSVTCEARTRNCTAGSFGFSAGPGYDLASGLGSVDAYNLVTSWPRQTSSISRATAIITSSGPSTPITATGLVNISVSVAAQSVSTIPTGTVTVASGSNTLASATLQPSRSAATTTATINAAQLAIGTNSLTISYSGDDSFNPAASSISLTVAGPGTSSGTPSISSVANGASFGHTFASGMVLTIFGSNLASTTWAADSVPLSTTASGTTVTIAGYAAPIFFVSPAQLNVQIPYEIFAGVTVPVIVTTNGRSASTSIRISSAAPGIFTDANNSLVPAGTARRGQTISLYVTGAGSLNPSVPTGAAPANSTPVSSLPLPRQSARVSIGGTDAPIQFIGVPYGLVGVVQINVLVPQTAPVGTDNLVVTIGGVVSNTARLVVSGQ